VTRAPLIGGVRFACIPRSSCTRVTQSFRLSRADRDSFTEHELLQQGAEPVLLRSGRWCNPRRGCVNTSGNTNNQCRPLTATIAARPSAWSGTVFTIVMENHDRTQILGNSAAPFINQLAQSGAVAAGYHDSYVHPGEPNYIWMIAGENFGILNDDDPQPGSAIASQSHLADQLERPGLTWKAALHLLIPAELSLITWHH
jgi:hypothetical protein